MPDAACPQSDTTHVLYARLLGRVSLADGERAIADQDWPPRGGRDLLLLLLATPGLRIPRDRVLEALWPERPADAARNTYYKALHSLRRILEPNIQTRQPGHFVVASADWLALAPGASEVDVDAFEGALAEAHTSVEDDEADILRSASELYRGDLLSEELGCEWASPRREQLHRAWQQAVLRLGEPELVHGLRDQAISRLEAVMAVDPTNEAAHRLLIRAFDDAGRRDLARRHYERLVAPLRDEFGVEPSAETLRFDQVVLRLVRMQLRVERHWSRRVRHVVQGRIRRRLLRARGQRLPS